MTDSISSPAVPTLDATDRRLLHALGINCRASFRQIAAVLGVSEQTAARRYRKLRDGGVVRVVMMQATNPADRGQLVRLEVAAPAARTIADVLARRPDVSWVRLMNAGTEILFGVRARARSERDLLLLDQLPRVGRILRIVVYSVLHHFRTPGEADWSGFPDRLQEHERRQLHTEFPPDMPTLGTKPSDRAIVDELADDGRASYARLAQVSGMSESAVARRLEVLMSAGALYGDVDISPELLGYPAGAALFLEVAPAAVPAVGALLAGHSQTAFVAAVGGPANLIASIRCRNVAEIYDYVTNTIGALEGVNRLEVSTVSRTIKHARTTTDEDRLTGIVVNPRNRRPAGRRTMAP
ncbi:Lrp/AsnC family transcriptional regulator [Mycobacterium vicinigordonae]|uniref:Lrp/AsnC family transcriptional regulator n=1 Tax=Mycobacterium vicinigordonae TaxID=1719132 RepID=A0A7D6E0Q2_9MYCO|nr:Lrp/AsnC family transcriptional regulator [Mycobacterium vicinigordonae]QLL09344.1 Lrp/AsnC family transcriptional regulator [Mycobacterium vicinigordonae]